MIIEEIITHIIKSEDYFDSNTINVELMILEFNEVFNPAIK